MRYIAYYEKKKEVILEFFPKNISAEDQERIRNAWNEPVARQILKFISQVENTNSTELKEAIGHSMSTLHENIVKLERDKLLRTEMIYEQNKKKIIFPEVLFVTKNSKLTEAITRFLNQGLLVDNKTGQKIIQFLDSNPDRAFTAEEISARTGIQVDEVETLLDIWDNLVCRAFSDFFKETPFTTRKIYQSKKGKKIDLKLDAPKETK